MKKIITIILPCILLFAYQDSMSQIVTVHQTPDIHGLVTDMHVDKNYENGNWETVLRAIKDKDIVLLGEPHHGAKEIFITRNDLIKRLHQQAGFDVILFESGIGEVGAIELNKTDLTNAQMTYGFFGGWRTSEFRDLMGYVKENNIAIGGFDVQRTGNGFNTLLETQAKKLSLDTPLYKGIEERFNQQKRLLTTRNASYDSLQPSTKRLIDDYRNLLLRFKNQSDHSNAKVNSLLIERTLENRIGYLEYYLEFTRSKNWNKRWKDRDSIMASNVEWLRNNLYPGRKIIIVAHNFHIAKFNEKEEVMGEFLKKRYGSEMYSLGVFAGSGSYADNSGKERQMKPVESERDIRKWILSLACKTCFLDIPGELEKTKKPSVLFEKVVVTDTFIDLYGSNELILSKHFDGVLFIDRTSPPDF